MATFAENKDHVSIVIVGHVDSGKSTTTGHLLYKLGGINERDMAKLKDLATQMGKESFGFAFYTDNNKEERERGITQSCNVKEFFTDTKHYSIIDAPGHRDFVKNMLKGSSQADVAQLMVPATGFEAAIARENINSGTIEGQTRQHASLCKLMGIEQMIVCINKMDAVDYKEERFKEIVDEVKLMLTEIGYNCDRIPFIPMSGYTGENLDVPSTNMPWYTGWSVEKKKGKITGVTLVDALDKSIIAPKKDQESAPIMPVGGIITNIKGAGTIITGRIEKGTFKKGDSVIFFPSGAKGSIFSIEMHHRQHDQAAHGDNVGLSIKGLDKKAGNFPKKGDVMLVNKPEKYPEQWGKVKSFNATIHVQNHPGMLKASNEKGTGGFTPVGFIRTANTPCQMLKIHKKMNKQTKEMEDTDENFVKRGDVADVTFVPKQPMYCTTFDGCKGLGRMAGIDSNKLIFLSKINKVQYA